MNKLNLDKINAKAPYKVLEEGKQLVFETQYGLHYEVKFFEEQPIGGCDTWQFSFAKAEDTEDQGFYAAIIVENRNPRLIDVTADFDQTAVSLTNKPGE